jgi:hypothetical protein
MRSEELEILPCWKCGQKPEFVPWPSQDFPVSFNVVCVSGPCERGGYFLTAYSKLELAKRRASLNTTIRWWNKLVLNSSKENNTSPSVSVTCKYCKQPGLFWVRRSQRSAWNNSTRAYRLHEKIELPKKEPVASQGTITFNFNFGFKYKLHNCLSTKNIVSVTQEKI